MSCYVMLDIETLGVGRGAAIVQVGAVRFYTNTGIVDRDRGFRMNVSLDSTIGNIEGGTLQWWLSQGYDAIEKVLKQGPRYPLASVLSEFAAWIKSDVPDGIWANAPTFDLILLRDAFDRHGMKFPISYSKELCFRTLARLGDAMGVVPPEREGVHHDGLDDACHQARAALRILSQMELTK